MDNSQQFMGSGTPSMPNLPGYALNKYNSWAFRGLDGFKKKPSISAPGASQGGKKFEMSYKNLIKEPNAISSQNRPSTAGNMRANAYSLMFGQSNDFGSQRPSSAGALSMRGSKKMMPTKIPKFVEMDRLVARFYGYFYQERPWAKNGPLGDPTIETHLCRHVTIMYYLENDTVEISEKVMPNSGMVAGVFFKRGKLMKTDTSPLDLTELYPGAVISILSRDFFISDADNFTRKYFSEKLNLDLPPGFARPEIMRQNFAAQYATGLGSQFEDEATRREAYVNAEQLAVQESMAKTNKFLNFDGKVLRFQCVEVESPNPPFFPALMDGPQDDRIVAPAGNQRYALGYYLSSDTIDIIIQTTKGAKKNDEPKVILKKSKVPVDWRRAQQTRGSYSAGYYEPKDLQCGGVVDIYGRYFLLVFCDRFTKEYYEDMGVEQQSVPLIEEEEVNIVHAIPKQGDGFLAIGSHEDTLGTVYGQPKPRRDEKKIMRNQGRLMRCKAKLVNSNPIDASRVFFITLNMEDDSIEVMEETIRNSGIWSGTYLKKGRYTNQQCEPPRLFVPQDIYLGNHISMNGCRFHIIEMDNMSMRFCETYPDEFPMSDLMRITTIVLDKCRTGSLDLRIIFRMADKTKSGLISQTSFITRLDSMGLVDQLNDQELITLMRRFKDKEGKYIYDELCDLMSHLYFFHPSRQKEQPATDAFELFKQSARMRTLQWRRTFRKDPHVLDGKMTLSVLEKIMQKHKMASLPAYVKTAITDMYSVPANEAIPVLKELHKIGAVDALFTGFDAKIGKKGDKSFFKENLRKSLDGSQMDLGGSGSQMEDDAPATPLPPNGRRFSILLKANKGDNKGSKSKGDSAKYTVNTIPQNTLIDYNRLCDDIYPSDWSNN
jgi:hypothetical protein